MDTNEITIEYFEAIAPTLSWCEMMGYFELMGFKPLDVDSIEEFAGLGCDLIKLN